MLLCNDDLKQDVPCLWIRAYNVLSDEIVMINLHPQEYRERKTAVAKGDQFDNFVVIGSNTKCH